MTWIGWWQLSTKCWPWWPWQWPQWLSLQRTPGGSSSHRWPSLVCSCVWHLCSVLSRSLLGTISLPASNRFVSDENLHLTTTCTPHSGTYSLPASNRFVSDENLHLTTNCSYKSLYTLAWYLQSAGIKQICVIHFLIREYTTAGTRRYIVPLLVHIILPLTFALTLLITLAHTQYTSKIYQPASKFLCRHLYHNLHL